MSPTDPYYELDEDLIAEREYQNSPEMVDYREKVAKAKKDVVFRSLTMSERFGDDGNPTLELFAENAFYDLIESVLIYRNLKKTRPWNFF